MCGDFSTVALILSAKKGEGTDIQMSLLLDPDGASAVGRSQRGPGASLTDVSRHLWHLDGPRAFRATPATWSPDQHELIDWLHCIEWQTVLSCTCLSVHCLGFNRGLI